MVHVEFGDWACLMANTIEQQTTAEKSFNKWIIITIPSTDSQVTKAFSTNRHIVVVYSFRAFLVITRRKTLKERKGDTKTEKLCAVVRRQQRKLPISRIFSKEARASNDKLLSSETPNSSYTEISQSRSTTGWKFIDKFFNCRIDTQTLEIAQLKRIFAEKISTIFIVTFIDDSRDDNRAHSHTHTVTLHVEWTTCEQTHQPNSLLNWRIDFNSVFPRISQILSLLSSTHTQIHRSHISCVHRQDEKLRNQR